MKFSKISVSFFQAALIVLAIQAMSKTASAAVLTSWTGSPANMVSDYSEPSLTRTR